ncbi:MAG: Holliday junction branch migration DNA helicase RuvB [Armatimonadetes bacterium]|nr:Holliday junction branch migration DNA helicase RuvB [Anaerolineae bacterium]
MTDDSRLISGTRRRDEKENFALRPQMLKDIVGQDKLRENLKIIIDAAQSRKEVMDHVLFYGPPGLGKTSLAYVIANEIGANIRITAGPSIERAGDLAAILTHLKQGDILFIDEIHRLGRAVEEILYPALEDYALDIVVGKGPTAKNVRINLPRFTCIGATTRLSLLAGPLRDRFGARFRLDYYELPAMEHIIRRAAGMLKVEITPEGITEVARRARGTPRVALRLLRRVRDYAQTRADGIITGPVAGKALELMDIDYLGLDDIDRRILRTIISKFNGGPVGLGTLGAAISEDTATIEEVYEPYLIQLGFLARTSRGRVATIHAYEHIGIAPPPDAPEKGDQPPLF